MTLAQNVTLLWQPVTDVIDTLEHVCQSPSHWVSSRH